MTKTKHTPGPWAIEMHASIAGIDSGWTTVSSAKNPGLIIAECGVRILPDLMPKEQMQANARLIAAAPELLEAAKVLDSYFDDPESYLEAIEASGDTEETIIQVNVADWCKLRAAIEKATE